MRNTDETKIIKRSGQLLHGIQENPASPSGDVVDPEKTRPMPELPGKKPVEKVLPKPITQSDFVRGWLVVIGGKGLGKSIEIGTGQNQIGRAPSNRIALPFDDMGISRSMHAIITYDTRGRDFYINGNLAVSNVTRLNGKLVLASERLTIGDIIEIGDTKLRFVPLCGETFDWSEVAPDGPVTESPNPVARSGDDYTGFPEAGSGDDYTRLNPS